MRLRLLFSIAFVIFMGCGKSAGLKAVKEPIQSGEPIPPSTFIPPTTCQTMEAKLTRTVPTGSVKVGDEVLFRVDASYCGRTDVVFKVRGVSQTFTSSIVLSHVFTEAGPVHDTYAVDSYSSQSSSTVLASKDVVVDLTVEPTAGTPPTTNPPPTTPPPSAVNPISVVTDLRMTPEGSHLDNGGPAPTGYLPSGANADCGWGICNGNQYIWRLVSSITSPTSPTSVIVDVAMTPPGVHIGGGPGLPASFTTFGAVADCGGGYCYGNQTLGFRKAAYSTLPAGSKYLVGITVEGYGARVPAGPACPAGYEKIGNIADCAAAICNGNETVCAKYAIK